ncbi:unnamed protein product [Albugo candida]|uniref:Uncharacterized protein n=1 Tax=Albugo candida TaxID=65357 RepID=A0A024G466_9STRA|nr:unnamed protein product [Albugo candida]|eukprot:CCI41436.1 unnamed protein product [Albugo candida]
MTELMSKTGFQSSRRILRQTFPSKSMFGWYIYTKRSDIKVCSLRTYLCMTPDFWRLMRIHLQTIIDFYLDTKIEIGADRFSSRIGSDTFTLKTVKSFVSGNVTFAASPPSSSAISVLVYSNKCFF